jgi:indole-3-glycerol phosphate synthase
MNFLETILTQKRDFIKRKKKELPQEKLESTIEFPLKQSRFKAILKKTGTHLIGEIKRASPSKGSLRPDLNILDIAGTYEREGIELVSVLCEENFFKGSLNDLAKVKQNTSLSILCKDFIIDSYQIFEAKNYGADAVLLIARILTKEELKEFLGIVKQLKMDAVVEIHNQGDLEKILPLADVEIVGINHRDLEDFTIDLEITKELLPKIPKDKIVISESGIETASQIKKFKQLKVNGILIGESLMLARDIPQKLKEFSSALK